MIAIVDYGMGNLRSVQKAFEHVGAQAAIATRPDDLVGAAKLVVPGVGAFRDALEHLQSRQLLEPIREFIQSGKPVMGICLGMQLLFSRSFEDGVHEGLGYFKGDVVRFNVSRPLKVPHMGWNQLQVVSGSPLLDGIGERPHVYFVHSYYCVPEDPAAVAAETEHGVTFAAVVHQGNVFGTQFHPEKSQQAGLAMIRNFAAI